MKPISENPIKEIKDSKRAVLTAGGIKEKWRNESKRGERERKDGPMGI